MYIEFGGYLLNENAKNLFLIVIDILLICIICFSIGMLLSATVNDYLTTDLDRKKTKLKLFGEVTLEALITIVLIYFVLFLVYLFPPLVNTPHEEHKKFRITGAHFLLTFAIIACQLKMLDKIRFIFNSEADTQAKRLDDIDQNWLSCNGNGFYCSPPL